MNVNPIYFITIILIVVHVHTASGQDWKNLDADALFQEARQNAFEGKREDAREMLQFVLHSSPDYHDARILLARTYAWDGMREKAREELHTVLKNDPDNEDAVNALIDVEMWDEEYDEALRLANDGLKRYPSSQDFLYKKARILQTLDRSDESLLILDQLLGLNPSHEQGARLLRDIRSKKFIYTAVINYGIDLFSRSFDPAHYISTQLNRKNSWGSSILRLNYASRFRSDGTQAEIDLYPRIINGVYGYLNYGYSNSGLFPEHRIGSELYASLPQNLELSGGIRYLYFDSNTKVIIYTGSLCWYLKNYWFSLRPYITPDEDTETSFSLTFFMRRYFQDRDNYIGLSGGFGFSPDERRIQSGAGLSNDGIYILKAQRAGLSWMKSLRKEFILSSSLDFVRQELIFDEGEYVLITSLVIGISKKF